MSAPDSILQLVENFEIHRRAYLSQDYNEAQVRLEFIDPFFEALGWDMFNKANYAFAYKDVIHEDALHMGGATKAPDYAFRIGGTRKFFVEAKKPAVNLKDAISPAYQLRRYAWSAKLPLSILTDFEGFTVYDCRLKPILTDKPSTGRIQLLTYRDYPTHWDEIDSVFSRQAVLKGSFDEYAEAATGKHGTAEVDHAFLAEIERWRVLLAHNIALRNPSLSQRDLNYAVQMTIDRLIFLRICEDRGIEFYGQLQALLNGGDVYPRLCQLFRNADDRYNSGLFHFRAEKGQADTPDALTLGLALDDKPLKDILGNLYYPESPYEFSVLPANILGQVYEQFLGKVIRLTSAHHAVVEDKPEVKKAGGVFYTPTFIVDYIVRHTLGDLLQNRHPGEVGLGKGTPIRVLDMACGSGSFLLGAYQYLLDWYLNAYAASEPEKKARGSSPQVVQTSYGEWRLTTSERKRILLDHIYGVDIDPQAVEVTKLSLLLKVLEGESQDTVGKQLSLFHQRALPDLGQNIKCGNSLIGPDFYSAKQSTLMDTEEQYRINAFDWQVEFPHVFDHPARLLWLVTFVTHNSRISERMVTYGVKSGDPLILDANDRLLIARNISEACHSHHISVVAWNVLPDHVHMILAAEDERELDEQVRKIKGFSSFSFQRARGWGKRGHVWAQKYHHLLITDQRMLENANSYVMDNHIKHAEQWGQELIASFDAHLASTTQPLPSEPPTRGLSSLLSDPASPLLSDPASPLLSDPASSLLSDPASPLLSDPARPLLSDPARPLLSDPTDPLLSDPASPLLESPSLKDVRDELCVTPEQACQSSSSGFDIIIGNPPYIQLSMADYYNKPTNDYLTQKYSSSMGRLNSFGLFIEQGLRNLLVKNGLLSFIVPNTILTQEYYQSLREQILNKSLVNITNYDFPVFENAVVETVVLVVKNAHSDENIVQIFECNNKEMVYRFHQIPQEVFLKSHRHAFMVKADESMVRFKDKLDQEGNILKSFVNINQAIALKYDRSKSLFMRKEADNFKPVLDGRNIQRYHIEWGGYFLAYDVNNIHSCKRTDIFDAKEKLFFRRVGDRLIATYDNNQYYALNTLVVITLLPNTQYSIKYILGLINSRLLNFYYVKFLKSTKKVFSEIQARQLAQLPIYYLNFSNLKDIQHHNQIVDLVERMLSLHQQLANALTPNEKTRLQRQIDTTDAQIDALVYELYGLAEDEIRLVEGR